MNHKESFDKLRSVVAALTSPDGCPWDREQTPLTLCDYVVEEAFELVEAIRSGDTAEAMEELGDVMFLLIFIGWLYEQDGAFTMSDALDANAAKMIRRHPHVFADTKIENQDDLLKNWERIKRGEKSEEDGGPKRVFASLPKGLPPLLRAYRIHSKAARVGFTWPTDEAADAQVDAERAEWEAALSDGEKPAMEDEFGDYLFTLVEAGRRRGIKANAALDFANRKFLARFEVMETMARGMGKDLADMDLEEMNGLWARAKTQTKPDQN